MLSVVPFVELSSGSSSSSDDVVLSVSDTVDEVLLLCSVLLLTELSLSVVTPPQAVTERVSKSAKMSAISFFIINSVLLFFGTFCPLR